MKLKIILFGYRLIVAMLLYSALFIGCKKAFFCENVIKPQFKDFSTNVTEFEPVVLQVESSPKQTYRWFAPNGTVTVGSSKVLGKVKKSQEGFYRVVTYNEKKCDSASSTLELKVSLIPVPCIPAVNSATYTSTGIPNQTYFAIGGVSGTSGNFEVIGNGNSTRIYFSFNGSEIPEDGYYSTEEVEIRLISFNLYTGIQGGAYVRQVNGKIELTFCDLTFSDGNLTFKGSGNLRIN